MNLAVSLKKSLVNSPVVATTAYVGVVIVLLIVTASTVIDLLGQRASVAATVAMLEQLESRKPAAAGKQSGDVGGPTGSAFLGGSTGTVAGAALLQRGAA